MAKREIGFDVSAYTARLIGRENVSKIEGAILELVKNAYDADATKVCIYYSNNRDCLYIMDNGTGMKEQVIIEHWMTIGNSSKKEKYYSAGSRIQTGAKGIGRFALDRLSDDCSMLTVTDSTALIWRVKWSDFATAQTISDVKATLEDTDINILEFVEVDAWENRDMAVFCEELQEDKFQKNNDFYHTGTVFCLRELRDAWNQEMMQKIRSHLENLVPPNLVEEFAIYLFDDNTRLSEAKIEPQEVDAYDYKVSFAIDEKSKQTIKVTIIRNEVDLGEKKEEFLKNEIFTKDDMEYFAGKTIEKTIEYSDSTTIAKGINIIGAFSGCFYFYKNSVSKTDAKKYYYKDITGRKSYQKEFGGIKVYRDNFRVRPYGEYGSSDFDWLQLANRKNRQPAAISHKTGRWRVAADQMTGTIRISRINRNLEDDANRNGIQAGDGLEQLKQIILAVINCFEEDRQYVGRKLARYYEQQEEIEAKIARLKEMAKLRKQWEEEQRKKQEEAQKSVRNGTMTEQEASDKNEPYRISTAEAVDVVTQLEEQKNQEIQDLMDELKMLRTLATTGIITNMFMHEIRTLTTNIGLELDGAYDFLYYDNDCKSGIDYVKKAIAHKQNFSSWFRVTIDSVKKDKRKRRKCNIDEVLREFMKTWQHILEQNGVQVHYQCAEDIEFKCYTFDVENIVSNLIANSLYSFERESERQLLKKEIAISISPTEKGFSLDYSDTGWGLSPKYKQNPEKILEAFETDKEGTSPDDEGTGMGMWIVNSTVLEYNGTIDLSKNRTAQTGFYATIQLGGNDV